MSDVRRTRNGRPVHHWRRDVVELAALFTAVAVADAVANLVGHGPGGPVLLAISAVALLATAGFHMVGTTPQPRTPDRRYRRPAAPHGARRAVGTARH